MAPPHTDKGSKPKPNKAKPSSPSSKAQHAATPSELSKRRSDGSKAADATVGDQKHDADPAVKVGKKHRQRGGRGRGGRGKRAAQTQQAEQSTEQTKPHAQQSQEHRTLLTLPEEIRRSIFTMALTEQCPIRVTKALKSPALLAVCRQTRDEATRLWIESNTFHVTVDRFDTRLLVAWTNFTKELGCTARIGLTVNDSHNWANLLQWAHLVHQQRGLATTNPGDNTTPGYAIANAAVDIAYSMVGKPWEDCKKMLENFRLALEVLDDGWI